MTKRPGVLALLLIVVFLVTSRGLYARDNGDESPNVLGLSDNQYHNESWLPPAAGVKNGAETRERPPLTVGKFAGSFVSGAVAGGLLGGAMGLAGYALFHSAEQDDISGTSGFIAGSIAGYTVGSSLGVFWLGNRGNQTGSYRATILGSVLGTAIGGAGVYLNERVLADPNWGGNDKLSAAIGLTCPPLCATIGYNISRRYESSSEEGASLMNLRDGRLSFAFPGVYLRTSYFDRDLVFQAVDLVSARF